MGALDNQVGVVTGGGRGIGRAIALRFLAEGASVVLSARTGSDLEEVLQTSGCGSDRGVAVVANALDRDASRLPVTTAIERFGRIDILVNNVGGQAGGDPDPFSGNDAAFEKTIQLSLTSVWWATSAALPAMRDQRSGRIITIGSGASTHAGGSLGYTTAKHGLVGFTRELAASVASHGINVNLLCPGWTRTSLLDFEAIARRNGTTPAEEEARATSESAQRRVLEPDELTGMAVLLAGPGGTGITGQVINVDGGYKL